MVKNVEDFFTSNPAPPASLNVAIAPHKAYCNGTEPEKRQLCRMFL